MRKDILMLFKSTSNESLKYRIYQLLRKMYYALRSDYTTKKSFIGSIFDRLQGLEFLMPYCKNTSVLDVGACDGLVAYEIARYGAAVIHGFEQNIDDISFARRLFRDVPCKTIFVEANIAVNSQAFRNQYKSILKELYDIVLFLGIYHHLKRQMPFDKLLLLLDTLLDLSGMWFVIRTDMIDECEPRILSKNFEIAYDAPKISAVGKLKIYKKNI